MSREMLPKVALQLLERRLHKDVEQDGQGDVLHGVHDDPVGLGLFKSFFIMQNSNSRKETLTRTVNERAGVERTCRALYQ